MERFIKRKKMGDESTSSSVVDFRYVPFVDLNSLPSDPALRKKISDYHPNQVDDIRRHYLSKGPCQPRNYDFPQKMVGTKLRRFNRDWFNQYSDWLEYSIVEDKAYCLCCYLFRDQINNQGLGAFITQGFSSWHKKDRLDAHVGGVNSAHYISLKKAEVLMRQEQSDAVAFHRQPGFVRNENKIQLCASIDSCRFLLNQGLSFRGHDDDESENSFNKGNFLELVNLMIGDQNDYVRSVAIGSAEMKNCQMVAPKIQKDIVHCFAQEITHKIVEECKGDYFSLVVDGSSDVSGKEHMALVLRFIDTCGNVKERFIGVVHVMDTSAPSLKSAIDGVFANMSLSLIKVRGQSYNGASNMRGEFNELKTLIVKENQFAYYVYCFAHQLQLALVAIAKEHADIAHFFNMISILKEVVGASCKRKDIIQQKQAEIVSEGIKSGLINLRARSNQELSLARASDILLGSHLESLLSLSSLFSSFVEVLRALSCDANDLLIKAQACALLGYMQSFDFIFNLQLMLTILMITNELSQTLERKDKDLLNDMTLVRVIKERLQATKNGGWESFLEKVIDSCTQNKIDCLDMNDEYVNRHRPLRKTHVTNDFHYRTECFYVIMDQQISEINAWFNEVNSELLLCVASLNPSDRFVDFNSSNLIRMAQFYPDDFSSIEYMALESQIETYITDVRSDERYHQLEGLADLCSLLVETKKYLSYPLVYRLLKFALILPVATPRVERCFSAMNIVKADLQNQICDQFVNDCLVCFIEKDLLRSVSNDDVIIRLQNMKLV